VVEEDATQDHGDVTQLLLHVTARNTTPEEVERGQCFRWCGVLLRSLHLGHDDDISGGRLSRKGYSLRVVFDPSY